MHQNNIELKKFQWNQIKLITPNILFEIQSFKTTMKPFACLLLALVIFSVWNAINEKKNNDKQLVLYKHSTEGLFHAKPTLFFYILLIIITNKRLKFTQVSPPFENYSIMFWRQQNFNNNYWKNNDIHVLIIV